MKIANLTPPKLRGEGNLGFRSVAPWRQQRKIDYDLYKGRHYGSPSAFSLAGVSGTASDYQPVNLHQQLVRTLVPFLAMNAPLADVTTKRADLAFEAEVRRQVYDAQSEELRLREVYREAAIDALLSPASFTLNLVKSGGEAFACGNQSLDMGRECTRLIDLDDIAVDPNAKSLTRDRRFIAYRYPVDRQDALDGVDEGCMGAVPQDYEDGILPNENIASPEEAREILSGILSIEGQGKSSERVDANDGDRVTGGERLSETIMLWDVVVYLSGQVWIITLPADPGMNDPFPAIGPDKFLACYRWKGPAQGPVNVLSFVDVPFNRMPLALAAMQRDLAEVVDILSNKIFRQLLRTKTMTVYRGDQENMAATMRRSAEGGWIRGDPTAIQTFQDGGLVGDMMPGSQYFSDHWQNTVGNMALASGTGDTGKTATAFEGLMSRVQGFLDYLRSNIEQLATDDLRVRAFMLSQNPILKQRVQKTIGQGMTAVSLSMMAINGQYGLPPGVTPDGAYSMQGDAEDFDIKCRAFSMQYQNPVVQANMVMKALAETIPACMQSGLDPRPALKILAKKLNEPELEDLIPDPVSEMMAQQESAIAGALQSNPTGDPQGYQQQGPGGRKTPGGRGMMAKTGAGGGPMGGRAMNPGPGTGSPRPMQAARPKAPRSMAAA